MQRKSFAFLKQQLRTGQPSLNKETQLSRRLRPQVKNQPKKDLDAMTTGFPNDEPPRSSVQVLATSGENTEKKRELQTEFTLTRFHSTHTRALARLPAHPRVPKPANNEWQGSAGYVSQRW